MVYDWDAHRQTCYRLYIEEGRSLEDIMEHMKSVHRFAPSKRAFQTQFRRWNFPPKQRPAYKNDRLVARVKELWERNLAQREMLRVLNEEDGFDIKARELMRVRTRNRWLLRAPNGDKTTGLELEDEDASLEEGTSALDGGTTLAPPNVNDVSSQRTASESLQDSDRAEDGGGGGKGDKRRRRRQRASADPSGSASTTRFPSETTLDEARRILSLDPTTYRILRTNFHRICQEEGVSKKTLAGAERWEAVKARLVREIPQLQTALWTAKDNTEPKKLALDVICTDVTKRMRNLETRMTLAEAKNLLGVNPEESREMRVAFHQVLAESRFTCKSEASPEQWEDLKRRWAERSGLVQKAMQDTGDDDQDSHKKARALEVMAKDVMKRIRDDKGRKDHRAAQQLPPSPAVSPHGGRPSRGAKIGQDQSSPPGDQMDLGEGMASGAFDDISEVSHASQMAFSPASSSMGTHMPISLQSQASDSQDGLPQRPRVLGASIAAGIGLESQMGSPLLLGANAQATFMDQPYVQPQFAAAATSAPVFPQVQTVSSACAVYLRLHPSSSFVANTSLWIATLGSHSLEELHQVAVEKFPGTVCVRVEGILKDGKGRELSLPVEQDQELAAYMTHLQGAAPTFNVQLVWKAS